MTCLPLNTYPTLLSSSISEYGNPMGTEQALKVQFPRALSTLKALQLTVSEHTFLHWLTFCDTPNVLHCLCHLETGPFHVGMPNEM